MFLSVCSTLTTWLVSPRARRCCRPGRPRPHWRRRLVPGHSGIAAHRGFADGPLGVPLHDHVFVPGSPASESGTSDLAHSHSERK